MSTSIYLLLKLKKPLLLEGEAGVGKSVMNWADRKKELAYMAMPDAYSVVDRAERKSLLTELVRATEPSVLIQSPEQNRWFMLALSEQRQGVYDC